MVGEEIADVMGWNRNELRVAALNSPTGRAVRGTLFARIVPNLKRLGLLTPRVRQAFTDLDIIEFEHMDPEFQEKQFGLV